MAKGFAYSNFIQHRLMDSAFAFLGKFKNFAKFWKLRKKMETGIWTMSERDNIW